MAIMFVRAQVISRGAGRNVVAAAAYRHRTRMMDEQAGTSFSYRRGASELVHEELAVPDQMPDWLRLAVEGRSVAGASEALWNAVEAFEKQANARLARELIIALPEELTRAENIALAREFVRDNFTSEAMVADWVYHDKDSNPHIHLLTTVRPLTEEGFGPKNAPVLGENGEPLRFVTPRRPTGRIVYKSWGGDKETLQAWKIAWAETANRHLALAGHEIRLDGRSYAEQGFDGIAQKHLGPEKAALSRRGAEMYFAPADLARRQEMADRLLADPALLLKQLSNERSTFDERDIAKALHRTVDDPAVFANIRARLMASDDLVMLKPQQIDAETGKASEPAVFTTREILRIEYDMARSAQVLSEHRGFAVSDRVVAAAVRNVETRDTDTSFQLDPEQVDAVRHVTRDNGIAAVVGLAGAGKSTLLAAARVAWEHDGRRVIGAALAGKAAEGLEDSSGIRSRTLASWELAWASGRELLERGNVLVIDEAGMVSSQQLARVLDIAELAQAKVVLVGDAMQLQPIQAGAAFRAITERIGFAELAGVRRQHQQWAREASRLFARGEVEQGLDVYARHGHLIEAGTRAETIDRIVADWSQARKLAIETSVREGNDGRLRGDELLVLAHTNEDVKRLNEALRSVMSEEGALSESRAFRTERGARDFAAGDRIIFLENARFLEPRAPRLGPQHVKNGMLGTVVSTGDKRGDTLLSVRLDNGRDVVISEDSYRNVDHGYAATIHKSQGSTVERTLVLATGMMDQHLTYVSLTRHRDRADLYAAREDFEATPGWGRKPRVDHAAGVTGALVETGLAKFRPNEEDTDDSPYADVRTDDGTVHRLWGVSLPKALEEGGVSEGDTVTLRKDGVERVTIKVAIVDEQTGQRRFEEREVDRNVWTAKQIETAAERQQRIERESHRPELFEQLVERLSRSGAKTTTLDFESEAGYRAQAQDFARRRGLDHLSLAAAGVEEAVSRRWAGIAEKREQLAKLWERAGVALGFTIDRERRVAYSEQRAEPQPVLAADVAGSRNLIPPTAGFAKSVEEDARLAQLASPAWKEREAILWPLLEAIYRDPDAALVALSALASDTSIEPRRLADDLAAAPERLGRLRGSDLIVDGRAARDERNAAITALADLLPLARAHATEFRKNAERFESRELQSRAHMSLPIPALSEKAMTRLTELEAVRRQGGDDAYKTAFALAAEDRSIVQEVKAVSEALTARFGWSAFTAKADAVAERNMIERMPVDVASIRGEKLTRLFEAVKRFADEQHAVDRRDRSKIVAAASADQGMEADRESAAVLPMLAAVTEFKTPVDEEARSRALATPLYRQQRAALADVASTIWRDPAGAVGKIEELLAKGFAAERIAVAVTNDPSAYGALRGSDRLMDRMLAAGRERKEAVLAMLEAGARLRALGSAYVNVLEAERQAVTEERRRMSVAIPGLSKVAEEVLMRLTAEAKNNRKPSAPASALDPGIRREFAAVGTALDERFGRSAIIRGEQDVITRVPHAQRHAFEAIQEKLKVLQEAVRRESSERIISERRQRVVSRSRGIDL
ncbi:Ti-type conjugative transfer relaxase TraA [Rhizobium ruizarguesonis]|uniref:Ti-type conjugative transfer relaxase TraA n=1 Tax=Rhizobium ruizarguesonis TaxID=2081791 RepID=UPI001030CB60|nr:Ti-type conjugative transfer relaxase TraA [Rhizobium ruizarguesonis]TAY77880.1 Ti-type conjugative transfer relaxase TraA [Rhizobium ruizarguesonis]TAZ33382.1 Ti-type conjugative transfer relaxase TraA [Rhizobium ruizarguesonis]TAZ76721.1 Ti-type conjugative transfer relaxase TraA [Rhizobium ruizarguesonis]TBA03354.1 Ti-type conjugative transfer relaxase TraA [Rhizobium ruizarguesonis]TBA56932.1 Ti-type conjugative transfer relaxase TraA [Rhizobium ruizarguesonis]